MIWQIWLAKHYGSRSNILLHIVFEYVFNEIAETDSIS